MAKARYGRAVGRRNFALFVVFIVAVLTAAPRVSAQATFYEAYARGLEQAAAGDFLAAREALLRAIEMRPEAGTRLRTYGLNFLDRYEPYLHVARAELELGLLEEAEEHAEIARRQGVASASDLDALGNSLAAARVAAEPPPPPLPSSTPDLPRSAPTQTSPSTSHDEAVMGVEEKTAPTTVASEPPPPLPPPPSERIEPSGQIVPSGQAATTEGSAALLRTGKEPVDGNPVEGRHSDIVDSSPAQSVSPPPPPSPAPKEEKREESETASPIEPGPVSTGDGGRASEGSSTDSGEIPTETGRPPDRDAAPEREADAGSVLSTKVSMLIGALFVIAVLGGFLLIRQGVSKKRDTTQSTGSAGELPAAASRVDASAGGPADEKTALLKVGGPGESSLGDLGVYRLQRVLGAGGMAQTFLAERRTDGRLTALKVPHDHLLNEQEGRERFLREGRLGATLHHPNIVRIDEASEADGKLFIAMEFLDGSPLSAVLGEEGRLPEHRALEIVRGISLALDYAHMKGVVHRDLKPDNIMILPGDDVKVMDYGIARLLTSPGVTVTGTYLGTPIYSAPEALVPNGIEPRSDLYSLGIIFYEMLVGKVPFWSTDPVQLLLLHRDSALPEPAEELGLSAEVVALMHRLTAKQPEDRYASAELLLRELGRLLHP